MTENVMRTEAEWRAELSPKEFYVLRQAGTEQPWSHEFVRPDPEDSAYVYRCRGCGSELFRSATKFESHCGWPSFYAPLAEDRVRYLTDDSLGQVRIEVRCAQCDSHLGHRFDGEGYETPTDMRYCINGIALSRETPA